MAVAGKELRVLLRQSERLPAACPARGAEPEEAVGAFPGL